MPRDTSTDTITKDLILAVVKVLKVLNGWGVITAPTADKAVYPELSLPFPQEPFPAGYVYQTSQPSDMGQGTGIRRDTHNITVRVIGGPATPKYKTDPEVAVYTMLTGIVNELSFRRYLEDPTNNNAPFRYIDPEFKVTVGTVGSVRGFKYADQGTFIGAEVPLSVGLMIRIGRLS